MTEAITNPVDESVRPYRGEYPRSGPPLTNPVDESVRPYRGEYPRSGPPLTNPVDESVRPYDSRSQVLPIQLRAGPLAVTACPYDNCSGRLPIQYPPTAFCPQCGREVRGRAGGPAFERESVEGMLALAREEAAKDGPKSFTARDIAELERCLAEWWQTGDAEAMYRASRTIVG